MLSGRRLFDASEVANQRMKIMRFYERYGEKAMMKAFGADRKVIAHGGSVLRMERVTSPPSYPYPPVHGVYDALPYPIPSSPLFEI
jgi:hypothetical protein